MTPVQKVAVARRSLRQAEDEMFLMLLVALVTERPADSKTTGEPT